MAWRIGLPFRVTLVVRCFKQLNRKEGRKERAERFITSQRNSEQGCAKLAQVTAIWDVEVEGGAVDRHD